MKKRRVQTDFDADEDAKENGKEDEKDEKKKEKEKENEKKEEEKEEEMKEEEEAENNRNEIDGVADDNDEDEDYFDEHDDGKDEDVEQNSATFGSQNNPSNSINTDRQTGKHTNNSNNADSDNSERNNRKNFQASDTPLFKSEMEGRRERKGFSISNKENKGNPGKIKFKKVIFTNEKTKNIMNNESREDRRVKRSFHLQKRPLLLCANSSAQVFVSKSNKVKIELKPQYLSVNIIEKSNKGHANKNSQQSNGLLAGGGGVGGGGGGVGGGGVDGGGDGYKLYSNNPLNAPLFFISYKGIFLFFLINNLKNLDQKNYSFN